MKVVTFFVTFLWSTGQENVTTKLTQHLLWHFHCLKGEKNVTTGQNVEVADAKGSLSQVNSFVIVKARSAVFSVN